MIEILQNSRPCKLINECFKRLHPEFELGAIIYEQFLGSLISQKMLDYQISINEIDVMFQTLNRSIRDEPASRTNHKKRSH